MIEKPLAAKTISCGVSPFKVWVAAIERSNPPAVSWRNSRRSMPGCFAVFCICDCLNLSQLLRVHKFVGKRAVFSGQQFIGKMNGDTVHRDFADGSWSSSREEMSRIQIRSGSESDRASS